MHRAVLAAIVSTGAVLTGCNGISDPQVQVGQGSAALPPAPVNEVGTGTLTVSVVDSEGRPLADAVSHRLQPLADADGR